MTTILTPIGSVIIIYDFAAWPKDKPDRIEALDIEALFSNDELLKGNVGLRSYLKRFQYGCKTNYGLTPFFRFALLTLLDKAAKRLRSIIGPS